MGIGNRLKEVSKIKKISIKKISEISGVSYNTLYAITKRDNKGIRTDLASKIAKALDMSVEELLGVDLANEEQVKTYSTTNINHPQEISNKREKWKQTVQEHNFQNGIGEILAIEEMSELIQAITKIQRARKGIIGDKKYLELMGNLIEEIADVKIAIDQLIYDWDIKEEVDIKEKEKIARTFERIQRGEE